MIVQTKSAVAVETLVLSAAAPAFALAKYGSPPLKPFHLASARRSPCYRPGMLCNPTKVAAASCQALFPEFSHSGDGSSMSFLLRQVASDRLNFEKRGVLISATRARNEAQASESLMSWSDAPDQVLQQKMRQPLETL